MALSLSAMPLLDGRAEIAFATDFSAARINPVQVAEPGAGVLDLVIGGTKSHNLGQLGSGGLSLVSQSTSAAFVEAAARFSGHPLELVETGDFIVVLATVTADAGILQGNSNSALAVGIYNSGGVNPPGGVTGQIRFDEGGYRSGGMQQWAGFLGQFENSGGANRLFSRPPQAVTSNSASQELLFPGNTGGMTGQTNLGTGGTGYSMTNGSVYTIRLAIERSSTGLLMEYILYAGPDTSGTVVTSVSGAANGAAMLTQSFDAIGFGYIRKGSSGSSSLTFHSLQISTNKPNFPAAITAQPSDLTLTRGGEGQLIAGVSGNPPIVYQWFHNNEALAPTDGPMLQFTDAGSGMEGSYYLSVSNAFGEDVSNTVTVTVTTADIAPSIQQHPADASANEGSEIVLSVVASGTAPLVYTWKKDGEPLDAPDSNQLVLTHVELTDSGSYTVVVSNSVDEVESTPAMVKIRSLPVFSGQPQSVLANPGEEVVLTAVATGVPAPTYQWFRKGAQMGGQTNATLRLTEISGANAGYYHVVASNSAGSTASDKALVNVLSPAQLLGSMQRTGTTDLPVDVQIVLDFDRPMRAGTSGKITVVRADSTVVDTIDFSWPSQIKKVGGLDYNYFPLITVGNSLILTLHTGVLDYASEYSVRIAPGAIVDASGATLHSIHDSTTIAFATRADAPAEGSRLISVDGNGSANFATVQGAIDFVPSGNPNRTHITIADGTYHELIYIPNTKPRITLNGQSRDGTVITYLNNATRNASNQRASFYSRASDLVLHSLTSFNSTPKGGSQAEAFNSSGQRVVVNNCAFYSFQDTHKLDGSVYILDSYIEGDVDFMWGSANAFFDNCHLHSVHRGYLTQVRNSQNGRGFVYLNCLITGEAAAAGTLLGRVDPGVFPFSSAAYINCRMGPHIDPVGWRLDNSSTAPDIRYFEFNSRDLDGNPLHVASRLQASRQIDAALAAQYSKPDWILGWNPTQRTWESAFRPTSIDGWATDPAFGWVFRFADNGEFSPWLFIANFSAWAYFFPSSPNSHFFYSQQISPQGWFWSSRSHPDFIYSYSSSQWIAGRP